MPVKTWSIDDANNAFKLYSSGFTLAETAEAFSCSQYKIRCMFKAIGKRLRTNAEAAAIMTPEQRKDRAFMANIAASRPQTLQHRINIAISREINQSGVSDEERSLAENISVPTVLQKAIGKYNVDILANGTVAVELFGGLWHERGRHAERHAERFEYILNAGFDVIIIWSVDGHRVTPSAIDGHVVSLTKFRERNPSAFRQCRVIWGTGELWGVFCKKHAYETSSVPSFRHRPHRFCGHKCFA